MCEYGHRTSTSANHKLLARLARIPVTAIVSSFESLFSEISDDTFPRPKWHYVYTSSMIRLLKQAARAFALAGLVLGGSLLVASPIVVSDVVNTTQLTVVTDAQNTPITFTMRGAAELLDDSADPHVFLISAGNEEGNDKLIAFDLSLEEQTETLVFPLAVFDPGMNAVAIPVQSISLTLIADPALLDLQSASSFHFELQNSGFDSDSGNRQFVYALDAITMTPEPVTVLLTGLPLIAFGAYRRFGKR